MPVYTRRVKREDGCFDVAGFSDDGDPFVGVENDEGRSYALEGDEYVCKVGGIRLWGSPVREHRARAVIGSTPADTPAIRVFADSPPVDGSAAPARRSRAAAVPVGVAGVVYVAAELGRGLLF